MKKAKSSNWKGSFFGSAPSDNDDIMSRQASGIDENVVAAADEAQQGGENAGKIKFKKAKKLTKKVGVQYSKALNDLKRSRFQDWTKMEMVELLVKEGVELRHESNIESESLVELCEALYFERDMPEKPALPTIFDIIRLNSAARKVQNRWVMKQYERRFRAENEHPDPVYHDMHNDENEEMGFGAAELAYMTAPKQMVVGGATIGNEMGDDHSQMLGANQATEGDDEGEVGPDGKRPPKKRKGMNILDTPWVAPDPEKARRYADYVQPRRGGKGGVKFDYFNTTTGRHCYLGGMGEQLDLWEEGQISEFGIYGSGVTNYFKFIKWCFWLFALLTVIAIPAVVLNDSGPAKSNSGLQSLARTTAGNLLSPYANVSLDLAIPGCNSYGVYNINCSLNKTTLATFYSIMDIIIVSVAFIAFLWLRKFEVVEEHTLEKNTVNASMFTVTVSNLPEECSEEELIAHFNKICPQHKIANISMAYNNAQEIEECVKRGDLIRGKVRAVHEHRHFCTKLKQKLGDEAAQEKINKERERFYARMAILSEELKKKEDLLAKFAESPSRPIFAFVTFDRAAGREAILEAFNGSSFIYNYLYNQHYKLKGKWLKLEQSPEPSTILWENLAYGKWESGRRRLLTSIIALLMILISLAMIFSAKYLEQVNNQESASELCPADFNSYTLEQKQDYVQQNPDQLSCYCDELSTVEQSSDSLCRNYLRKSIQAQLLTYFASMIVLFVNILIEKVLKWLSAYEKHNSEDARGTSTFLRLFILKYINTTLVFFINNNNVILKRIFGVATESTTEFTADWFNTIGVTVILVQLGDVFSCHGDKISKWFFFHRRKRAARVNELALTQDDLNQSQVGPEFEFAFSYAQLLSTFFCCFTFSTGIPLLYSISMMNYLLYYFVEKYLFIHLYRIPPHFSNNVGKRATAMLPYAFILHLVMSIWVLSNKELFINEHTDSNGSARVNSGNSTVQEKISGRATFPLFVFLVGILFIRFSTHLYKGSAHTVKWILEKFCGARCASLGSAAAAKKKAASAMAVVTYTRAVQRNLIKGLATYNILQNPTYKEAFAITWKFAMTNKNVRSVRNNKAKASATADETDADKVEHMVRNFKAAKKAKSMNKGFSASFYQQPNEEGGGDEETGGAGGGAGDGEADTRGIQLTVNTNNRNSAERKLPATPQAGSRPGSRPPSQAVSQQGTPKSAGRGSPRIGGQYQQGGPMDPNFALSMDPQEAEAQRRAYAVYQAQYAQQQQMVQRGSQKGRGVNIAPLGPNRNSNNNMQQYATASASYASYSEVSNTSTGVHYAQAIGYSTSAGGGAGVPYAQTMTRGTVTASGTYIPAGQSYTPVSTSASNSRSGSNANSAQGTPSSRSTGASGPRSGYDPRDPRARGGSYTPVSQSGVQLSGRSSGASSGRRIDNDGFENADHLLYD